MKKSATLLLLAALVILLCVTLTSQSDGERFVAAATAQARRAASWFVVVSGRLEDASHGEHAAYVVLLRRCQGSALRALAPLHMRLHVVLHSPLLPFKLSHGLSF